MKKIITIFSLISFLFISAQNEEYEGGVVLFMTFNLETISVVEKTETKYADLHRAVKTEDSYEFYMKDAKGLTKFILKKLDGYDAEDYEYVDVQTGQKYIVKDLLNTSVMALDAINTKNLPGLSNKYKMMIRILVNKKIPK